MHYTPRDHVSHVHSMRTCVAHATLHLHISCSSLTSIAYPLPASLTRQFTCACHTHTWCIIYILLCPQNSHHTRDQLTHDFRWPDTSPYDVTQANGATNRSNGSHPKPPSCIKKSIAYLIYANSAWRSTWLHHVALYNTQCTTSTWHDWWHCYIGGNAQHAFARQATRAEQASLYHFEKEQSLRSFKLFRPRLCIPHFTVPGDRFSLFVLVAHKGSGPLLLGYYGSLIGCETAWSCCSNNVVIPFLRLSEIVNVLIRLHCVVVGLSGFAPYPSSDSYVSSSWFEILHPKC